MTPASDRVRLFRAAALVAAATLLPSWGASPAAEKLAIRTFAASDGLGSSFVSHIHQDAAGYLWFATRDGLSRWNGYEFATYGQDDGFASPAIGSAIQSRSGAYFVVANDGTLYSSDPARAESRSADGRLVFRRRSVTFEGRDIVFRRLYEDRSGVLWGGGRGVLVRGLGDRETTIVLSAPATPGAPSADVHALCEDSSGTLWIGTGAGLFRRDADGRLEHFLLTPPAGLGAVTAIALDRRGLLWIGHSQLGVFVFNPGPEAGGPANRPIVVRPATEPTLPPDPAPGQAVVFDQRNGLRDSRVLSLLAGRDGLIWAGTGGGLVRFGPNGLVRYSKAHGLCDDLIHALAEDGDGNLWVGTPNGAMYVRLDGFSSYTTDEGLGHNHVAGLGEMPDGRVFGIGIDWSISLFDGERFRAQVMPLPAGRSPMWATQAGHRDRSGRWWALANQGLYRFATDASTGLPSLRGPLEVFGSREGLKSARAFRLYEARDGTFWVGTRSGQPADDGLARFMPDRRRATVMAEADGLPPHAAPSAFAEDAFGNLWVGFYDGGLARYRAGRFRTFGPADGIPAGMVTALLADGSGRLWMATNSDGLGRIDNPAAEVPVVRRYGTGQGLASNNVRVLTADRAGRIYAGSVRGVDRLDPATGRVRHYGRADGLTSDFITAALCDSSGRLWFGSYAGVFRLRDGGEPSDQPPPVSVTRLRVSGEPYPLLELGESRVGPLVLGPDQRDLSIEYVSVSRRQARGLTYQYSLDGNGSGWSPPSHLRIVNFARMSPGTYQFAVRAVTADHTVSEAPATIRFTIRPPVWQRWWAQGLAVAALAGILFALHRYRVRRLLEVERLRMAIAADLHDDVATNLSSIATFSTLVRDSLDAPSPLLDRITVLATESVDAIREIIWSIDPKPESIASLLYRLHDALAPACRSRGIQLVVDAPADDHLGGNLTAAQRKHLWLLLKEAVSNAVKHSEGTEIRVSATRGGRHVRFTVTDNGAGLRDGNGSGTAGRGLTTMAARAASLGGRVTVTGEPGQGTTVEFVSDRFE